MPPVRAQRSCSYSPPSLIGADAGEAFRQPREPPQPAPPTEEESYGWQLVMSPPTGSVHGDCAEAMQCCLPGQGGASRKISGWGMVPLRRLLRGYCSRLRNG